MFDPELQRLNEVCATLHDQADARAVILFDKSGQFITSSGELEDLDLVSLAALAAAHMAAAGGMAQILGERFDSVFHESPEGCLYLSLVDNRAILVVLYGEDSSLGLMRMRAKVAERDLRVVIEDMLRKHADASGAVDITTYEGIPGLRRSML